jgi:hypothetical protein
MFGSTRVLLVAGATLLAAALALGGYVLYAKNQKRVDEQNLSALVGETTALLRQALATPSTEGIAALEAGLEKLKTARSRAFAGAAEQYIISAREIARRRLDGERLLREAAASRQALIGHMNRSGRRDSAWIRDALELKRRVERDHADLARALKTEDELLYGLVDAQKQLAPFVDAALLLPDAERERARAQAQAEAKRADTELQKMRNLTP